MHLHGQHLFTSDTITKYKKKEIAHWKASGGHVSSASVQRMPSRLRPHRIENISYVLDSRFSGNPILAANDGEDDRRHHFVQEELQIVQDQFRLPRQYPTLEEIIFEGQKESIQTFIEALLPFGITLDRMVAESVKQHIELRKESAKQPSQPTQPQVFFSYFSQPHYSLSKPLSAAADYFTSAYQSVVRNFKGLFADYVAPNYITLKFKTRYRLRKRKRIDRLVAVEYSAAKTNYAANTLYSIATETYHKAVQYLKSKTASRQYTLPASLNAFEHQPAYRAQIQQKELLSSKQNAPVLNYRLQQTITQEDKKLYALNPKKNDEQITPAHTLPLPYLSLETRKSQSPRMQMSELPMYIINASANDTKFLHPQENMVYTLHTQTLESKMAQNAHVSQISPSKSGLVERVLDAPFVPQTAFKAPVPIREYGQEKAGEVYRDVDGREIGTVIFKKVMTEEDSKIAGGRTLLHLVKHYHSMSGHEVEFQVSRYQEQQTKNWITDVMVVSKKDPTNLLFHYLLGDVPLYDHSGEHMNPLRAEIPFGKELTIVAHKRNPGYVYRWDAEKKKLDWEHGGSDAYRVKITQQDIGKTVESIVIRQSAKLGISHQDALEMYRNNLLSVTEQKNANEFGGTPIEFSQKQRVVGSQTGSFELSYRKVISVGYQEQIRKAA